MLALAFKPSETDLKLLCLGAHSDDLEIGCAGSILDWLTRYPNAEVTWVVFSAAGLRAREARESADELLRGAKRVNIVLHELRDGFFPAQFEEAKQLFETIKNTMDPNVILTHRLEDRHQDHRLVAELTWQTFRDHFVLEYEIPKYEGDLGQPGVYVALSESAAQRKIDHLQRYFGSQRSKTWFRPETFSGLMRLRGIECRAESGCAEAFHARKIRL